MDLQNDMIASHKTTATIFCGLMEGYDGKIHDINEAYDICREYCEEVSMGVTVTSTVFIYKGGEERGVIVGLINYPMYPKLVDEVRFHAIALARRLRDGLKQKRVSVITPSETITIGEVK